MRVIRRGLAQGHEQAERGGASALAFGCVTGLALLQARTQFAQDGLASRRHELTANVSQLSDPAEHDATRRRTGPFAVVAVMDFPIHQQGQAFFKAHRGGFGLAQLLFQRAGQDNVCGHGGELAVPLATGMTGDPLAAMQQFHRVVGDARIDLLPDQRMRHAVGMLGMLAKTLSVDRSFCKRNGHGHSRCAGNSNASQTNRLYTCNGAPPAPGLPGSDQAAEQCARHQQAGRQARVDQFDRLGVAAPGRME